MSTIPDTDRFGEARDGYDARTGAAPAPSGPLSWIDYSERIPNNVGLATDRKLQRALEGWQPKFMNWWGEMGPTLRTHGVYLRTATSVGPISAHQCMNFGCQPSRARCRRRSSARSTLFGILAS